SPGAACAVTATMCRFGPMATVWRGLVGIGVRENTDEALNAGVTASVTVAGCLSASHTGTLVGVTLRTIGPAITIGTPANRELSGVHAIPHPPYHQDLTSLSAANKYATSPCCSFKD